MPPGYTHTLLYQSLEAGLWSPAQDYLEKGLPSLLLVPALAHNSNSIIHPCGFLFFSSLDCLLMHHQSSPELGRCSCRRALSMNPLPPQLGKALGKKETPIS